MAITHNLNVIGTALRGFERMGRLARERLDVCGLRGGVPGGVE